MRRRPGATLKAATTETLWRWRPNVRSRGVLPFRAQVRRTSGFKKKPLSSISTRWAPSAWAFFECAARLRPASASRPRRPVPWRAARASLRRVTAGRQPFDQVIRVEADAPPALDEGGQPSTRPQLARKTEGRGRLGQPTQHGPFLAAGELTWSARARLGVEPVEIAALPTGIDPTVNAALSDAGKGGDFWHGVAFQNPGHGQTPAPLQLLRCSMTPHLANLPSNAPPARDFTFLKINSCSQSTESGHPPGSSVTH